MTIGQKEFDALPGITRREVVLSAVEVDYFQYVRVDDLMRRIHQRTGIKMLRQEVEDAKNSLVRKRREEEKTKEKAKEVIINMPRQDLEKLVNSIRQEV